MFLLIDHSNDRTAESTKHDVITHLLKVTDEKFNHQREIEREESKLDH